MNNTRRIFLNVFVMIFICVISFAQDKSTIIDLSKVSDANIWKVFNRNVSLDNENDNVVLHFNSQPGDGFARLLNYNFYNGTIEVDIKGKDTQGKSIVGIAFRGMNDSTFDAVYFRPFNFMNSDSVRRSHSVQYISEPLYTWSKLRKEFTGKYENRIEHAPDPNSFFHAKVIIEKPKISVFVNNNENPCLVVKELSDRTGGWVGLWVGYYSEGSFKNLKITKKD